MSVPTRAELREWTRNLALVPLDVADPEETRYVPLADAGRSAVDELQVTIELALDTTAQLLSGPAGAGKTTELYRLRRDLVNAGYHAAVFAGRRPGSPLPAACRLPPAQPPRPTRAMS